MTVKEYMDLPYTRVIRKVSNEEGTYYFGTILELDGCMSDGATIEELYENLNEAMEGYIQVKLENGFDVPLPESSDGYSGKFNLRLPKSLHQSLAIRAKEQGVSLNQYILYKLASV